jgi:hypothetical protein
MPPAAALFIVEKIIEQAATDHIALSEIEGKMLLFSESSPALTDMLEVNNIFGRDYDRVAYEAKIVDLIKHIKSSLRENADAARVWNEAVRSLRGEDYYFMVMLNEAGSHERPPGKLSRLVVTAIAIVAVLVTVILWIVR